MASIAADAYDVSALRAHDIYIHYSPYSQARHVF